MELLIKFHNIVPPHEDGHGTVHGAATGLYSWPFGQLHFALNLADPAEAGTLVTTPATYTGYSLATYSRGISNWTLVGAGTATPAMKNTKPIVWPEKSNSGTQDIAAVSYGYFYSATDYSIARDALGAAVTIHQFERPTLGALAFVVESL